MKRRLDQRLVELGAVPTRSQAESYIRMGEVTVNNKIVTKAGQLVGEADTVELKAKERYVSRAAFKLASVADSLGLDFKDKVMLDVGSSTGGFTDYALRQGARKVIAVDVGTNQLHPSLHGHERIELHEKTDIRDFKANEHIDLIVADVSFVSLRDILPHISTLMSGDTRLVAMVKPQFEAVESSQKHKGVIKNDAVRRKILQGFESWVKDLFAIMAKADSHVSGSRGNVERFYLLQNQNNIDKS